MESLWRKQVQEISAKEISGATNEIWDVIVVGAGMAGLLTAYFLQEKGKKVLTLEAKTIASGQTERTTAKVTSQHAVKYSTLIDKVGTQQAKLYAQANELAISEYEKLIQEKNIDCEWERCNAYLYTTQNVQKLDKEKKACEAIGLDVIETTETELPFTIKKAIGLQNQACFQPLKFVKEIAKELQIIEHEKVIKIKGHHVITEKNVYQAEKIVIATHYPIKNIPGFYFLRQHQSRSYAMALSGCGKIYNLYYGIDISGLSFRQSGDYLLLGGCSHRTGESPTAGIYDYLEHMAQTYYPDAKVEAYWAAQDCMPHDGIPYIGKYSLWTPNLYVATGFQKWGMTSSMVAAMILRDEVCGVQNLYSKVFTPQRCNLRAGGKHFLHDVRESISGLCKGLFTTSAPRCRHLGCKLEWNQEEQSWDCPCHGSRYKKTGEILDNPTLKNCK